MQVTMAQLNKQANSIINQSVASGETVTIKKHGKAIAEIHPIPDVSESERALAYLSKLKPIKVKKTISDVMAEGRQRGI